jgi:hypothetical protein
MSTGNDQVLKAYLKNKELLKSWPNIKIQPTQTTTIIGFKDCDKAITFLSLQLLNHELVTKEAGAFKALLYHAEEATTRHEEQGFKGTGLLSN